MKVRDYAAYKEAWAGWAEALFQWIAGDLRKLRASETMVRAWTKALRRRLKERGD